MKKILFILFLTIFTISATLPPTILEDQITQQINGTVYRSICGWSIYRNGIKVATVKHTVDAEWGSGNLVRIIYTNKVSWTKTGWTLSFRSSYKSPGWVDNAIYRTSWLLNPGSFMYSFTTKAWGSVPGKFTCTSA